jgi:hypothetical protein
MELIRPIDKVTCSSRYSLQTAAFDLNNTPSGSYRANANAIITTDFPKGVLGGSCARSSAAWEAREGIHTAQVLGLFAKNSEGNAFENSPAIASGVVSIYMNGGNFYLYIFETADQNTPFSASQLGNYNFGTPLYCSAYGLLTPQLPSAQTTPGTDNIVALCTKVPSASDLELGIKLLV